MTETPQPTQSEPLAPLPDRILGAGAAVGILLAQTTAIVGWTHGDSDVVLLIKTGFATLGVLALMLALTWPLHEENLRRIWSTQFFTLLVLGIPAAALWVHLINGAVS